jgi:RHH-type rel operon transcriptional repressor/antitoxin RelB
VREAILEHLDEIEEKYLAVDRLEKAGNNLASNALELE